LPTNILGFKNILYDCGKIELPRIASSACGIQVLDNPSRAVNSQTPSNYVGARVFICARRVQLDMNFTFCQISAPLDLLCTVIVFNGGRWENNIVGFPSEETCQIHTMVKIPLCLY
jgi:hypothetical protein